MRIVNVMASSLDGKIAAATIESDEARATYGMTSEADRLHLIEQLRQADAVITGANSVRSSDTLWDVPNAKGRLPDWFVFSNAGLEQEYGFWKQDQVRRTIVTLNANQACFDPAVDVWTFEPECMVQRFVAKLRQCGYQQVLLFGGGIINRMFYAAEAVDQLVLTLCPTLLATANSVPLIQPGLERPVALRLSQLRRVENHLFLTYNIEKEG